MAQTPHETIRQWLPHLLLVMALAVLFWLLLSVLTPLFEPLLLASSLAALTYPILYEPLIRGMARWLPFLPEGIRHQIGGILSTLVVVLFIASPILLLLLSAIGDLSEVWEVIIGLVSKDAERLQPLFDEVRRQLQRLGELYPGLPIDHDAFVVWLRETLIETTNLKHHVVDFLFRGTGSLLATLLLALLILTNLYVKGGRVVRFLLRYTPLSEAECGRLGTRHRQIVLRLLNDTVATAVVRGASIGLLAWAVTGANVILITLVGAFVSLIPVIGSSMVWIPLVLLEWSQSDIWQAMVLAIGGLSLNLLTSWARLRLGRRIDSGAEWLGFMLFLGLIGGLLAYGIQGLVIGPMVVVLSVLLARYFLPLYGIGEADSEAAEPDVPIPP